MQDEKIKIVDIHKLKLAKLYLWWDKDLQKNLDATIEILDEFAPKTGILMEIDNNLNKLDGTTDMDKSKGRIL